MKFSFRQILASTAGAVIAAIIASTFGVKGTIVGVAIGSAAATMATAFVAQSIERGHEAVKQAAVKAPESATLLRRLGGTGATGDTHASAASAPTEMMGRATAADDAGAETVEMASTAAPAAETGRLEISAAADAPATEHLQATTRPVQPAIGRPGPAVRRFSWRAIAASAAIVFVLALLLITAVELISGKPLTAIFGGADTGTSVKNLFTPPPAPTTTPTSNTTTTSTSPPSSSTTTTTTAATTTSTTAPAGQTTTTTSPAPSSSTTTAGVGATSTTTVSSAP